MNAEPQIFTFYSFKGGVGRSMAVLNAAYAMAAKGCNVLVLDMDLEAPGLSGFLRRNGEIGCCATLDMVDLVGWARDCNRVSGQESQPVERAAIPPLSDYVVPVPRENISKTARDLLDVGRVDIIPVDIIPVDEERDYYGRLTALAVNTFDREALIRVGSLLREWLKSRVFPLEVPEYYGPNAAHSAAYDYVLVDSRTGVTELGGLCIGPLSDQLVVLTALNDQNVEGTRKFLEEVGVLAPRPAATEGASGADTKAKRLDPKPTLIVASPVPAGEIEFKKKRLQVLKKALGPVMVKLSYHPQMALFETIFTRDYPDEYLTQEYRTLVKHLLRAGRDDLDFDFVQEWQKLRTEPPAARREAIERALRPGASQGSRLMRVLFDSTNFDATTEDADFVLLDRVYRTLARTGSGLGSGTILNWANLLAKWSLRSDDPELATQRFEVALRCYGEILENVRSPLQKAMVLYNRGVTYGKRGDTEKGIADYSAVIEMPDAPAEQKAQALVNRGVTYGKRGDTEKEIADYSAVIQMADAPVEQKANALVNRGVTYGKRGDTEKGIADYSAVIQMADATAEQKAKALVNRGVTYGKRGDTEKEIADYSAVIQMADAPAEQKATALVNRGWAHYESGRFSEGIDDANNAIALNPTDCSAHGNLAVCLLVAGRIDEARAAYDAALRIASPTDLDAMTTDLRAAIKKHGSLPGAEEALARIAARRGELQG